jgi:hypothetical protein
VSERVYLRFDSCYANASENRSERAYASFPLTRAGAMAESLRPFRGIILPKTPSNAPTTFEQCRGTSDCHDPDQTQKHPVALLPSAALRGVSAAGR